MKKTISFELSEKSITNAQKELNNILKKMQTQVNREFISMSLDWIKNKAIEYLYASGFGNSIIQQIRGSFSTTIKNNEGSLVVAHEKGAYVEFGVGKIAKQSPHPEASSLGWEYDVDSGYKSLTSRSWVFALDNDEVLNIRYEDTTQLSRTKSVYMTQGSKGAFFMYNAIMDYANNISIVGKIYENAIQKVLGG